MDCVQCITVHRHRCHPCHASRRRDVRLASEKASECQWVAMSVYKKRLRDASLV